MKRIFTIIALASTAGCNGLGICDEGIYYAIEMALVDSISGQPVAGEISAIAIDGSFADTVTYTSAQTQAWQARLLLLKDRPGTYRVQAEVTDYKPWSVSGVRVVKGDCHVEPVHLLARMQR